MNILLIQTAFLGDFIITLPFLDAVSNAFKVSRLFILARPFAKDLLSGTPYESGLIAYDKNGAEKGIFNLIKKIRAVRTEKIDLVLSPHLSLRSGLMAYFSGAPERRGFDKSQGKLFFNRIFPYDFYSGEHYLEKLFKLLPEHKAGIKNRFDFTFSPENESKAEALLKNAPNPVGLGIGSNWDIKRFPYEKWAGLAERLINNGYTPVLFGSQSEMETAAVIKKTMSKTACEKLLDLTGKTDIWLIKSLLKRLRLFISNDTGLMHLAVLLDVPVAALFGPTDRSLGFYPLSGRSIIVEKSVSCRPCGLHGARKCKKGARICFDFSENEVYNLAIGLLKGK